MKDINETIEYFGDTKIMTLGEIVRYNDRKKIRKESVAEHSFYVAHNVVKICSLYNVPDEIKHTALEMAIAHDIPEIFTGDIGYITKRDNPELAKALEITELKQLKKNMPEHYQAFKSYVEGLKNKDTASIIVKLADVISVLQYSNNEIDLGNSSSEMDEINQDALERVELYLNLLLNK